MYNDEKNLYHYTYRKDGSEPTLPVQSAGPLVEDRPAGEQNGPPLRDMKFPQKRRMGMKIAALALCCALLGGAVGGGIVWAADKGGDDTSVSISGRPAAAVSLKTVDGKSAMTDAEVYVANVNSVVSINTSATVNYFGQPVETASSGSGFILTADGFIVTNYHVVEDATSVKVTLYSGDSYDAGIIGYDADYDIAVIKVEAAALQPVTLGDSDQLNVGDRVLAIGNPLGELSFSMSGGMASSVNRAINVSGTPFNMIQTDTSINPGNSGGPLLNSYGEVVGIVSAKYSNTNSGTVEGLGFAIPMNDVLAMIQDIMTNGYVTNKPYLGVTAGTMNAAMAQQTNLTEGVYIYSVEADGAAAKAGLQVGDVITKVGDTKVSTMEDLSAVKKSYSAGDVTPFTVYRAGQSLTVQLTWGSVPPAEKAPTVSPSASQDQNGFDSGSGSLNDLFGSFFGNQFGGYSDRAA